MLLSPFVTSLSFLCAIVQFHDVSVIPPIAYCGIVGVAVFFGSMVPGPESISMGGSRSFLLMCGQYSRNTFVPAANANEIPRFPKVWPTPWESAGRYAFARPAAPSGPRIPAQLVVVLP